MLRHPQLAIVILSAAKNLPPSHPKSIVLIKEASNPKLKLVNISHTFGQGTPVLKTALHGVSLHLTEGEFACVVGSNGAGKSTLLNAVAGAYHPDQGQVIIGGQDVTGLAEHRRARSVGRVFQNPLHGTAPNMTVEENLALAAERGRFLGLRGILSANRKRDLRDRVAHLGLGLEDRLTTKVGLLSGGQRQALTLLMATLVRPKVLLLDEHTAALDPATADRVLELTTQLVAEHRLTTLMVTHNLLQAVSLGSRLLMMHDGEVILDLKGEQKSSLTTEGLRSLFASARGQTFEDDRALLA
jgi:putative ABC transport system ATP-binding protein